MTKLDKHRTKIAVFGSAFNPPTIGHKSVIESLNHFDSVLLIPSIAHAWGKEMLCYQHRCELVDCFIEDLATGNVQRSVVEEKIHTPGGSVTTFAVLNRLQEEFPDSDLTFVIGPDNFFNFSRFYKAEEILEQWSVIVCPEKVKVRSTLIRERIKSGDAVSDLTTPGVVNYLKHHSLYV